MTRTFVLALIVVLGGVLVVSAVAATRAPTPTAPAAPAAAGATAPASPSDYPGKPFGGKVRQVDLWGRPVAAAATKAAATDADVLIENTETGKTLVKNNLKILETLFESTGCVIGNSESLADPAKKDRINSLVDIFKKGLAAPSPQ